MLFLAPNTRRYGADGYPTDDTPYGEPPDRRAIACARTHGLDISGQRARQLNRDDFGHFDWLLCADASVVRDVLRIAPPGSEGKVALLLEWAGVGEGGEIPDPYTGGTADFERVWQLVDSAASAVVRRLSQM